MCFCDSPSPLCSCETFFIRLLFSGEIKLVYNWQVLKTKGKNQTPFSIFIWFLSTTTIYIKYKHNMDCDMHTNFSSTNHHSLNSHLPLLLSFGTVKVWFSPPLCKPNYSKIKLLSFDQKIDKVVKSSQLSLYLKFRVQITLL